MIEGLLGKKIGMTRVFVDGASVPVTVIQAGSTQVTQVKTAAKEGYDAVQLGFLEKRKERANKASKGHFDKAGTPCFYHSMEFRGGELKDLKPGSAIKPSDVFKVGDFVDVAGTSKGKGFLGVVGRWMFSGGAKSHGSMHNRAPGSIGSSSYPSRVFKGMRMGGHTGDRKATIQNLKVVDIKDDVLLIKGAVPGATGAIVVLKKASKKKKKG